MNKINIGSLKVDSELAEFLNNEAIPGTDLDVDKFWSGFDS